MANDVNGDGTARASAARSDYRVARTHEGPMGSLTEGSIISVEAGDQRTEGMVKAGMIEAVDQSAGGSTTRRGAASKKADSGDSAAQNG